jgi:hypothetical protein
VQLTDAPVPQSARAAQVHRLFAHPGRPCSVQLLLQLPQCVGALFVTVSHPSSAPAVVRMQLERPSTQLDVHVPALHAAEATPVLLHERLHAPQ